MKLNTHERTPKPETGKTLIALFALAAVLIYGIFWLAAFACFLYAENIFAGMLIMAIPLLLTVIIFVIIRDKEKAYIEINETGIHTADYYFGIKKEKHFSAADITSYEIVPASSSKVKGRRYGNGAQYIVFYNDKKYLFKVICFPETEEMLKKYI